MMNSPFFKALPGASSFEPKACNARGLTEE
jgi:hypothetical protein